MAATTESAGPGRKSSAKPAGEEGPLGDLIPFADDRERNQFILQYIPTIHHIAYRVGGAPHGPIPRDGLVNAGVIGLIDALNKYDSRKKVKFRTYAEYRIRGAILDELRSLDFISRDTRVKMKRMDRVHNDLTNRKLGPVEDEEMAEAMGLSLEKYYGQVRRVNVNIVRDPETWKDASSSVSEGSPQGTAPENPCADPSRLYAENERKKFLVKAIQALKRREKIIIQLYYYEQLSLKEIGEVMGVSESRVCQIHGEALKKLKAGLRDSLGAKEC